MNSETTQDTTAFKEMPSLKIMADVNSATQSLNTVICTPYTKAAAVVVIGKATIEEQREPTLLEETRGFMINTKEGIAIG